MSFKRFVLKLCLSLLSVKKVLTQLEAESVCSLCRKELRENACSVETKIDIKFQKEITKYSPAMAVKERKTAMQRKVLIVSEFYQVGP